ncbi:hypothetical protein B484DRAFT_456722 [Ochromonadaceae sp. CCMP2298]|nr:hypothetical protein B484DRAFT_456722 [Ochromonadaceae sp. CCMP2298]
MILDKIIEHEGCVVPDICLRTGRRTRSSDGKKLLLHKPCSRQRISTLAMRPSHPDAAEARRLIKDPQAVTDMEIAADELGELMDADTDDEEEDADLRALREADMEE